MSLYKYFPPDRTDVLKNHRIRYSQPAVFNDPFEAKPHYTGLADEAQLLDAYRRVFHQGLPKLYDSLPSAVRDKLTLEQLELICEHCQPQLDDTFRRHHKATMHNASKLMYENFGMGIGVLSLTKDKDNLLMWSHYAVGHTGFVLEFDGAHNIFGGYKASSDEIWGLHEVRYADERPQTIVSDLSMAAVLMTKGKPWKYEREWRAFRPLNQAAEKKEAQPFPVFLFDLPPSCVRSIIYGARMTNETRENLLDALEHDPAYAHVNVFQALNDNKKYALHFAPVLRG